MTSKRNKINEATGERMLAIRKQLGKTRKQMAALLGIGAAGLKKNEIGATFPNLQILQKLQNQYEISLDWLIFGKGPMLFKAKEGAAKDNGNETGTLSGLMPDVKEMIDDMGKDPLLRHELLGFYFKYKKNVGEGVMR